MTEPLSDAQHWVVIFLVTGMISGFLAIAILLGFGFAFLAITVASAAMAFSLAREALGIKKAKP